MRKWIGRLLAVLLGAVLGLGILLAILVATSPAPPKPLFAHELLFPDGMNATIVAEALVYAPPCVLIPYREMTLSVCQPVAIKSRPYTEESQAPPAQSPGNVPQTSAGQ